MLCPVRSAWLFATGRRYARVGGRKGGGTAFALFAAAKPLD